MTWKMDFEKYGKPDYRASLIKEMQLAGFRVVVSENVQDRFAVIDNEIVWYGSMDLLGKEYVDQHPQLYKQILEDGIEKEDNERLYRIGLEAMKKIPENKLIRSEIAFLTSEYAYRSNQRSVVEYCWLEAFRSDTSVMNYMRLRFRAESWKSRWDGHQHL